MDLMTVFEKTLISCLLVSFFAGTCLMTLGLFVATNFISLVENYVDPAVKRSNLTRTFVARYGAIVPTKDYIPVDIDLGPWVTWLPEAVLDTGVTIMIFSLVGICFVKSRSATVMYLFIGFLSMSVFSQFIFMVNLMDVKSELHFRVKRWLMKRLRNDYEFGAKTHNTFTFLFNAIMLMGECCGVDSPRDFTRSKHSYVHTGGNNITHNATVLFPLACCQKHYIDAGFQDALGCALSWSPLYINEKGCYMSVFAYIFERYGTVILWSYVTISYIELLQMFLGLWLTRMYRKKEIELARARQKLLPLDQTTIDSGPKETDF